MKQAFRLIVALVAAGVLASGVAGQAADWPQWRYDAARSARSPDDLPASLRLSWQRQLPLPRPAWPASQPSLRFDASYNPVAAGQTLYVPSMVTDSLSAFDTRTGRLRWRFVADAPIRFAPIAADGRVWFASDDGRLYCLDAATGKRIWTFRGAPVERRVLGNNRLISTWPMRGGPVLADGVIYCANGIWPFMGIFIHAVDARTGKTLWTNSSESFRYQHHPHAGAYAFGSIVPHGPLSIDGDKLIVHGGRTPPASFDRKTGKLIDFNFARKGGRDTQGPVRITAGRLTYTPQGNTVKSSNGWTATVDGPIWTLLAADDRLFVVTRTGRLYCFADAAIPPPPTTTPSNPPTASRPASAWVRWFSRPENRRPDVNEPIPATDFISRDRGYALVLGAPANPPDDLAQTIEADGPRRWIVLDPDAQKIDRLRRDMIAGNVYGMNFSACAGDVLTLHLPAYFAERIVVADAQAAGLKRGAVFLRAVFELLRPYGGTAILPIEAKTLEQQVAQAQLVGAQVRSDGPGRSLLIRAGALPGAADWTSQYADPANSVVSRDRRVKAPLGLLWFGNGPSNDQVLPRHGHGPAPQVAAGRLFIEGPDMLRAQDIYTGRLLWQRRLPNLGAFYNRTNHQPGAGEIGGNYVSQPDAVYVIDGPKIHRLDAATGRTTATFDEPQGAAFGYLGVLGDALVAGAGPVAVTERGFQSTRYASASKRLVVMDRQTGRIRWSRKARYSFRHNNIALADGKIFCIDGLSEPKQQRLRRRGLIEPNYQPRLLALDINSGQVAWSAAKNIFGTFLNYCVERHLLLQAGSAARDRAKDESNTGMVVYRGQTGQVVWQDLDRKFSGPCLLRDDTIITQHEAYSLLTGQPLERRHPLTGQPMAWTFSRTYGCNTVVGSWNLLTFRSGAAGFYDLADDGGTGNFGGFKSGCTSNLIVAGGLLNAPEYTRTCTCNYQNQTSLALAPDPDVETWTFNDIDWDGRPVRRVGINFGAPGDRRDAEGTLWLDWPSVGGASPDLPLSVKGPAVQTFYRHSALMSGEARPGCPRWITGSALTGAAQLRLTLARRSTEARRYTVRLIFIEPDETVEPGQRVFDVQLQGKTVEADVDIRRTTGGPWRPLIRQFESVAVTETLEISLVSRQGNPPAICGLQVVAER